MTPESTNSLDLIKGQMGTANLAHAEQAAKGLAAKGKGPEADKKRWKTALDFQSMFLTQMYKSMRQSTLAEGNELTQASPGREIFSEMLDTEYAGLDAKNPLISGPQGMKNAQTGISNSLASQIYRALRRAEGTDPTSVNPTSADATSAPMSPNPSSAAQAGADTRSGKHAASMSEAALKPIVELASATYGVSANLIKSVIKAESANQPAAVSGAGAKGLMQLMDSTAQSLGVRNPFNAEENVLAGTRYLKDLLDRYDGDETKALAAYNAGPTAVDRYRGVPPFPETKTYVDTVMNAKRGLDAAQGI
jgi:soluble lytic murein transglycosylase-like protein